MIDQADGGGRAIPGGSPPQRSEAGRICRNEGCETRLSIYNRLDYCAACILPEPATVPRAPGKRGPRSEPGR